MTAEYANSNRFWTSELLSSGVRSSEDSLPHRSFFAGLVLLYYISHTPFFLTQSKEQEM